jgi:thiamine pyrophosphokinase
MTHEHALIFIGGDSPHVNVLSQLDKESFVIAADSGYGNALKLGLLPHMLVGDMDSVSEDHIAHARARNIEIIEYPTDKDETDTEIALDAARARQNTSVTLVAGGGDRFDHVMAMMHSVAGHAGHVSVRAYVGPARIDFLAGPSTTSISTTIGATLSLIPLGGNVALTTLGLQWNLTQETLQALTSRGVSNIATHNDIYLSITHGTLAVIQPHFLTHGATH